MNKNSQKEKEQNVKLLKELEKYKQEFQSNIQETDMNKKTIDDYNFHIRTNKQTDYELSSEFFINYIKWTFQHGNDIAESLRTLSLDDILELRPKYSTSEAINQTTQIGIQGEPWLIHQTLHHNPTKFIQAYVFLWERCTKGMLNKISSWKAFKTNIFKNPIDLLISITKHPLNYQQTIYEMAIITNSIRADFKC